MIPFNYAEFIVDLTQLVKNNIIPMDRIDDAVARILLVKFSMGLFENPLADFSLVNELGSQVSQSVPSFRLCPSICKFPIAIYFMN
jgi:beta-glucosidase